MKTILSTLSVVLMLALSACGGGKDAVDKDGLQGRYQLNIGELVKETMAANGGNIDLLASMFLSKLEITVQFETEKAILDASGAVSELLKSYTSDEFSLPMAVEYKIENDTVLYIKQEGKDFKDIGVLKRLGDSYDYLKFITTIDDKRVETSLKRVK